MHLGAARASVSVKAPFEVRFEPVSSTTSNVKRVQRYKLVIDIAMSMLGRAVPHSVVR